MSAWSSCGRARAGPRSGCFLDRPRRGRDLRLAGGAIGPHHRHRLRPRLPGRRRRLEDEAPPRPGLHRLLHPGPSALGAGSRAGVQPDRRPRHLSGRPQDHPRGRRRPGAGRAGPHRRIRAGDAAVRRKRRALGQSGGHRRRDGRCARPDHRRLPCARAAAARGRLGGDRLHRDVQRQDTAGARDPARRRTRRGHDGAHPGGTPSPDAAPEGAHGPGLRTALPRRPSTWRTSWWRTASRCFSTASSSATCCRTSTCSTIWPSC